MTQTASGPTWKIDPVHSTAEFELEHLKISTWRTRFRTVKGALTLDPANLAQASVEASIDPKSIVVEGDALYKRLQDDEFFASERFPEITFRSSRVEGVQGNRFAVHGTLSIKGNERPVVLNVEYLGTANNPFSKQPTAAFRATAELDRGEFGLKWNAPLDTGAPYLGEKVKVTLHIEAGRAG